MQWTDEDGGSYGEDPYGGAGQYAYGYEYATGTHPCAAGTHPHAAGPDPATTAWDSAHGDVLTVPLPRFDTAGHPVPESDTHAGQSVRPVFVDSSGRRQRRVLRAARLLAIPAGGYVALLISTMLGGPSISSPFVPQPDSPHPTAPRATAPDSGHSGESTSPTTARKKAGPALRQTPGVPRRSAVSTAPAATSGPTATPTRTTKPNQAATPTSKGRALGSSHHPVK
ncbi:hypothetical protein ACWC09_38355 [Streptomyces sp. NPDC001617]